MLVFFEDIAILDEFYDHKNVQALAPTKLHERVNAKTRPSLVSRAVSNSTVTLLTRDFGRGTDFMCEEEKIDKCGGVHVIQTFVSDEISEEMQIRGWFVLMLHVVV